MQFNAPSIRKNTALGNDELLAAAPSIFANVAHDHMSDRYAFLPTINVIDGLRSAGYLPVAARQSVSNKPNGGLYARHEIRFRHAEAIERLQTLHQPGRHVFMRNGEGEFDELVLVNSHDGASPFALSHGIFRLVCHNGLIVARQDGEQVRIRHSGNIVDNVIEGATRVLEDVELIRGLRDDMRALALDKEEEQAFAAAALQLRYNGEAPILPSAVLQRRREEDAGSDLWTVLNVVQENLIKGGVRGHTIATGRRMTTRGITGITQDHAINRMLWSLADAARNMKETLGLDDLAEQVEQVEEV